MSTAGQKILWSIDFHTSGHASEKPEISFVAKHRSMHLPPMRPMDAPMRDKTQEFLNKIQALCKNISSECRTTDMDYLKSHLVSKEFGEDLGKLGKLIEKLNEILRRLKPPESGDDPRDTQ